MAELTKVRKRSGELADFDRTRISNAIFSAAKAVGGRNRRKAENLSNTIADYLSENFSDENPPTVEDIQDAVEKHLIEAGHAKTAKAYILYRERHGELRRFGNVLNHIETVNSYISKLDWRVKENSNMAYSLQGLNNYISSILTTDF